MDTVVQQVIENHLITAAEHVEAELDAQLHRLDNLDEDEMEKIRQRRIQQLKQQAEKKKEWQQKGHGEYREVPGEKEFFAEMKGEERMICHFFRDNWPCKVMDKHLQILAAKHLETKFVKVHAEKSPFLTDRLKIWMLPTLALIKKEKTIDYVVGFDDMGGKDDFSTEALAARLGKSGLINYELNEHYGPQRGQAQRSVRASNINKELDEDSDFSD